MDGKLIISTKPQGAKILINDKHVGETPLHVLSVVPGKYYYSIFSDGYNEFNSEVIIKNHKLSNIFIDLDTGEKMEEYAELEEIKSNNYDCNNNDLDVIDLRKTNASVNSLANPIKFRVPAPGTPPIPPGPIPPGDATALLAQHLTDMNVILDRNNDLLQDLKTYLTYQSPTGDWQEFQVKLNVATPNPAGVPPNFPNQQQDPQQETDNISTPGYLIIDVWSAKNQTNAQKMWCVNDGGGLNNEPILVRQSSADQQFSQEFAMINGEVRIFSDVRDVRLRSTDSGQIIRLSEREIKPPYVTTITNSFSSSTTPFTNQPNFIAQNFPIPFPGDTVLPSITIPNSFALFIIANVNNLGQVFLSNTNATIAAQRTTLAAGDTRKLLIKNSNVIHVAASAAGNSVDLLVEQP